MHWTCFDVSECFISRETPKAVRLRIPRWVPGVVGSFWLPRGCVSDCGHLRTVRIPETLRVEVVYKKEDDFGEMPSEWQKGAMSHARLKAIYTELCPLGNPSDGDTMWKYRAPELAPVKTEVLEELKDAQ